MPRKDQTHIDAVVEITDTMAVIREHGSSTVETARVLGCDRGPGGEPVRVYLDRLITGPAVLTLGDWQVSGAVTTILSA